MSVSEQDPLSKANIDKQEGEEEIIYDNKTFDSFGAFAYYYFQEYLDRLVNISKDPQMTKNCQDALSKDLYSKIKELESELLVSGDVFKDELNDFVLTADPQAKYETEN